MPTFLTGRVIEWTQAGAAPDITVKYANSSQVSAVSRENSGTGEAQLIAQYILDAAAGAGGAVADYTKLLKLAADGLITAPVNEISKSTPQVPSVI